MQEAAESAAGKKGVPRGPQGTKGIVILPNDTSWSSPGDKKKKKWFDQCEKQNLRFVHERPFFVFFVCFVHEHQVGRRPCS